MTIDKQALREAAEKADSGDWSYGEFNSPDLTGGAHIRINGRGAVYCLNKATGGIKQSRAVLAYIAAFNPKVALALLNEVEAAEKRNAEQQRSLDLRKFLLSSAYEAQRDFAEALGCAGDNESIMEAIDGLKQRIAELEAREVMLPDRKSEIFWPGDAFEFDILGYVIAVESAIRAAGIGVKQQEDSVDSDAGSRNQPGMVVAVHIDAGDFVKVKGQVFEVEETDFDDHDVTLWFVGGNALRCAAGCPVEVVSAPVAAGIKVKE
ncbi:ead/Ea22-like family protein [Salmonella enterica]|nr:ead/Ea22-like family protein [Salmonella enterica]